MHNRDPEHLFSALAEAYRDAPIQRTIDLAMFRVDVDKGIVHGVVAGIELPSVLDADGVVKAQRELLKGEVTDAGTTPQSVDDAPARTEDSGPPPSREGVAPSEPGTADIRCTSFACLRPRGPSRR